MSGKAKECVFARNLPVLTAFYLSKAILRYGYNVYILNWFEVIALNLYKIPNLNIVHSNIHIFVFDLCSFWYY